MITACQPAEVETRISVCTPCPEALSCAGAFGIDNKVYVLAGRDSKENLINRLYCYDCTSDQWEDKGVTPLQKRVYPITVVLDDIVYIGLGFNGGSIYTEENYLRDFFIPPQPIHGNALPTIPTATRMRQLHLVTTDSSMQGSVRMAATAKTCMFTTLNKTSG